MGDEALLELLALAERFGALREALEELEQLRVHSTGEGQRLGEELSPG